MAKEKLKLVVGEIYTLSPENVEVVLVRYGKVYASVKLDGKEVDFKIDRLKKFEAKFSTTVEEVKKFEQENDVEGVEIPEHLSDPIKILKTKQK